MPITESAITLTFPDANYFRFQDCKGYRDIQQDFKEMDVCWYDSTADTLYIIELKDWGNNTLTEESDSNFAKEEIQKMKERISNYRIGELVKKSIDSICMVNSILLNKPYAINIQNCSPFSISSTTKIYLLNIINWEDPDPTYISTIHTAYKLKFNAYAKLFQLKAMVLTKSKAIELFPSWIS